MQYKSFTSAEFPYMQLDLSLAGDSRMTRKTSESDFKRQNFIVL